MHVTAGRKARSRTQGWSHRLRRRAGDRAQLDLAGLLHRRCHRCAGRPRRCARAGHHAGVVRTDAADRVGVLLPQQGRSGLRHDVLLGHPRDGPLGRLARWLGDHDDRCPRRRFARRRRGQLHTAWVRARLVGRQRLDQAIAGGAADPRDDRDLRRRHRRVGKAAERPDPGPGRLPPDLRGGRDLPGLRRHQHARFDQAGIRAGSTRSRRAGRP